MNWKGQMAIWRSDSRVESDIFPGPWHSSWSTLSFKSTWYSANSFFIFSESWLKFEQWGAGGCCLTFHLTSLWILLPVSSCQKLYTLSQSRYNEGWFSKYCCNPKFWNKKVLTNFLNIYNIAWTNMKKKKQVGILMTFCSGWEKKLLKTTPLLFVLFPFRKELVSGWYKLWFEPVGRGYCFLLFKHKLSHNIKKIQKRKS